MTRVIAEAIAGGEVVIAPGHGAGGAPGPGQRAGQATVRRTARQNRYRRSVQ